MKLIRKHLHDKILTIGMLGILTGGMVLPAEANNWQEPASIAESAEQFVVRSQQLNQQWQTATAQAPDARLRLKSCTLPLQASAISNRRGASRVTVKVACTSETPWKVYVPVTIASFEHVVVAQGNLPRGHVITTADVTLKRDNVANHAGGYLNDVKQAVGHVLRQSVMAGTVISAAHVKQSDVIKRGQVVTLVSANSGISIRMSGVATTNAPLGARLAVRNQSSGRIIEGIVVGNGEVHVPGPLNGAPGR